MQINFNSVEYENNAKYVVKHLLNNCDSFQLHQVGSYKGRQARKGQIYNMWESPFQLTSF